MAEADSTVTQGDTWPPQRFRLLDHKGNLVSFDDADEAKR